MFLKACFYASPCCKFCGLCTGILDIGVCLLMCLMSCLQLENYIQENVRSEMERNVIHTQTATMLEIGTNLLSQSAENTRKLTDVETQVRLIRWHWQHPEKEMALQQASVCLCCEMLFLEWLKPQAATWAPLTPSFVQHSLLYYANCSIICIGDSQSNRILQWLIIFTLVELSEFTKLGLSAHLTLKALLPILDNVCMFFLLIWIHGQQKQG